MCHLGSNVRSRKELNVKSRKSDEIYTMFNLCPSNATVQDLLLVKHEEILVCTFSFNSNIEVLAKLAHGFLELSAIEIEVKSLNGGLMLISPFF